MTDQTDPDDTRNDTVTTFACRIGLEPYPGPSGELIHTVCIKLWRSPMNPNGLPSPRISGFTIRRKDIQLSTKAPLNPEQHAAIADACKAFDLAVGSVPDGDPPDVEFFQDGEHWTYRNPKWPPFFAPANLDREVVRVLAWRHHQQHGGTVAR